MARESFQSVDLLLLPRERFLLRLDLLLLKSDLRGLLLDVPTWSREGLVDAVVAAGYYRDGGNAEMAWNALRKETDGKVDVWYFGWVPRAIVDFERDFAAANQQGLL